MKQVLILFMIFVINASLVPVVQASSDYAMANVLPAMREADFWLKNLKNPDEVIMNQSQIDSYNQAVRMKLPDLVYDLRRYPPTITKKELVRLIAIEDKLPDTPQYINGKLATAEYYRQLKALCNVNGIAAVTPVRYGFTVSRTSIRTLPTADCVTSQSNDREFDNMQETTLDPAEPVILLHTSTNKAWYYVQSYNYRGWISAKAVAIASSRQQWLEYIDAPEFVTVIDSKVIVGEQEFAMGAKLVLADRQLSPLLIDRITTKGSYVVKLPARGSNGTLVFELVPVAKEGLVKGYLPYTRANLIVQAFKLHGQRYGWGGMNGGWDCSSLVLDVYRSFGFKLPRNADEQEQAAGNTVNFTGSNRVSQLAGMDPGAALYMPGHAMLYLGEYAGRPYIIHALGGYNSANGRVPVMQVVVSDLSLTLRNGKKFIDALTSGKEFQ